MRFVVCLLIAAASAAPPAPSPHLAVPPSPPGEKRVTCGGSYGWFSENSWGNRACPPPQWEPAWELNRSTVMWTPWGPEQARGGGILGYDDPKNASRWGWVTYDWSLASGIWQNEHPHNNEAVLAEQCKRVKAQGSGTRCMVYRNNELALQWQESSRAAMTAENGDKGWFLKFKAQAACDAAAPCNIAANHNIRNQSAPLVPCDKTAPNAAPNCCMCCNFTRVYNEPVGGPWPPSPGSNGSRFGDNALNDGQFFWDFRNADAQDYWAKEVCLAGTADESVDGMFTDDPPGYGAEHPAVQSAVQLDGDEIAALQLGTQQAWTKALALLTQAKKYFPQAYRTTPPFAYNTTAAGVASCTSWMRAQCALPANESTQTYGTNAPSNMTVASFLVSRGPWSYLSAPGGLIPAGDWSDPNFRLFRLDTGRPTGDCTEATAGVFSRAWSGGRAAVDCTTATATLDFNMLKPSDCGDE